MKGLNRMNKPKFRAWDKEAEEMIYQTDNGDEYVWMIGNNEIWIEQINEQKIPEQILMQYTGLKDKNGVEICEYDRLHYSNCDGEIDVITKRNGCFWSGDTPLYQCAFEEAEIIGNIYEF